MKIPKGWPTEEMLDAGRSYLVGADLLDHFMRDVELQPIFTAMLAAAPTPPAQVVEACVEPYKSHQCLDCGKVIEPTRPAQEAEPLDRAKIRDAIQELAWDVFNNRLHPIEIAERVDALYPPNLADNDKLRQAAGDALIFFEGFFGPSDHHVKNNLRAALEGKS